MAKPRRSGSIIEPLEARRMLSAAGILISSAQPASWSDYASSTIGGNFSGSWWQGGASGGGTRTLVIGIHNSQGRWVSGTSPYALWQDIPPTNSPGDSWQMEFSGVDIPATPGNYTLVAAMENTYSNTIAQTDFEDDLDLADAVIGSVTALACNPGISLSNVSQTTWNTPISSSISGSFTASMWNGTTNPNNSVSLIVGIRNSSGNWVGATEPQDLKDDTPPVGPPGDSYSISFSGLSVPSKPGIYNVVAALDPFSDTDSVQAYEASADLATATVGTVTVTPSSTVWGPLFQFPSWNQSGNITYTSNATFNQDAPIDPAASGNRSVTGCVATAEAQLAYYWRSMKSLSFSSADAYVSSQGTASQVSIDGNSTVDHFPDFAALNSSLSNITYDGSPSEIAMLEFGLGVKAQADFSYAATSASVTTQELQNLGYSSAQWSSDWTSIEPTVIANIQAGEPVLLQVPNHVCIIDGYNQTNNTFHLDLGWGGMDDGWYALPYYNAFAGTSTDGVVTGIAYDLRPATPLAASLTFTSIPSSTSGTGFSVSVTLDDATGNIATGDTSSVTLAIASGPNGATLSGNLTVAAVNGVATFTNLSLNASGTYTLSAADASASLSGYISGNITVKNTVPVTPAFGNLTVSPSVAQGTANAAFGGSIAAGALIPPTTEVVDITLNGVTENAAITASGSFSTTFNISALPASNTPYQVTYAYGGDANFNSVTDNTTTTLLVMPTNGTETPVYRLYSQITKEHLYTADLNEYNTLGTRGWDQEGLAYNDYTGLITVGGVTTEPLYRLYNIPTQQHLWTTDPNEYNTLKNFVGTWSVDGISGYIFPANGSTSTFLAAVPGSAALYRMSWPFDPAEGLHLWTTDLNEYNTDAATYGWTKEGIIGYVL